jgi:hypothetical protein
MDKEPKKPAGTTRPPNVDILKEVTAAAKALKPAADRLRKALSSLDPKKLTFGAASDLLYDLRAVKGQVPALNAPFEDVLSVAVKSLEDYFVDSLKVGELSGVQGMASRTQVNDHPVPVVKPEDWQKFWEYVARSKQWDLLPRSINAAAVKERWNAKKQVKFVGVFHAKKVSCTKLAGKGGPPAKKGGPLVKKGGTK